METGAPCPMALLTDSELYLIFYSKIRNTNGIQEQNIASDNHINVMKFNNYVQSKFGIPSNETLSGHPYYKLGLRSYSFYQVEDSDWIANLKKMQSIHPYYNEKKWESYNHYVLTFHDNMFECIAKDFEVEKKSTSVAKGMQLILTEIAK